MAKELLILCRPPKVHIANLEVAPKVTGGVPICLLVVRRASVVFLEPAHGIVGMQVFGVLCNELLHRRPQQRDALWRVVDIDHEPIRLVVVGHVVEDIVVNVAEEMNIRFHAPVVAEVLQRRVMVEEARVPTAHFVVAAHGRILHVHLP